MYESENIIDCQCRYFICRRLFILKPISRLAIYTFFVTIKLLSIYFYANETANLMNPNTFGSNGKHRNYQRETLSHTIDIVKLDYFVLSPTATIIPFHSTHLILSRSIYLGIFVKIPNKSATAKSLISTVNKS